MFSLAERLGHEDPHAMAERMSSRLLTEWMGYFRLRAVRREEAAKRNRKL